MPKILFYVALFFFFVVVRGQEIQIDSIYYYNDLYNPHDTIAGILSMAVEETEDGFLVFGNRGFTANTKTNYVRKTDKQGKNLWIKDYDIGTIQEKGIIQAGEQVIQNLAGNLMLIYSYDTTGVGNKRLFKLVEMDTAGTILQSTLVGDTAKLEVGRAIVEVDDGYVFTGFQATDSTRRIAVVKVDYELNEIWTTYHAESLGTPYHLRKTFWDDGFLVSGFSYTNDETGFDSHTLKLDSEGNLEWEYIDELPGDNSATTAIIPFLETSYNEEQPIEYLVLSAQTVPPSEEPFDSANDLAFSKLDENGNLFFKKVYEIEAFDRAIYFESVRVINDSTAVVSINNNYSIADRDNLLANISTIDGEVRWVQRLQTNDEPHRQDYMRDLQQTEDGGFILAGFRQTPGVQRSWIVKTDSLGNTCGFADCDSLVVVETIIEEPQDSTDVFVHNIENVDFRVYPNPASRHIWLVGKQLEGQRFFIQNAIGQNVISGFLGKNQSSISVEALPKGLYFINVTCDDQLFRQKFMKQ